MLKYYYEDKNKTEISTKLVACGCEDGKYWAAIEDSIFYPQGGGQKGDRGYLIIGKERYTILNTVKHLEDVSHLLLDRSIDPQFIGQEITGYLDWEFRYRQMRLHTCLHLYHCMMEEEKGSSLTYPLISTIEDGFAFNKYEEASLEDIDFDRVTTKFLECIQTSCLIKTYPDIKKEDYRWWECMHYSIPCGGIHVDDVREIGDVNIEISHKKKNVTIKIVLQ